MAAPPRRAIDATHVTARLIQRCKATDAGAVQVAGGWLRALPLAGLNGKAGWQKTHWERWQGTEGQWTMDFPLTTGPDGLLHITRFAQRTDPQFMPGDEFVEIRRDGPPKLLFTGALVNAPSIGAGLLQVGGYDAFWLLNLTRETEAGFWVHAPRDALEHYSRVWAFDVATGFPERGAAPVAPSATPTTTGSFTYVGANTATGLPVCRLFPSGGGGAVVLATAPPNIGYASADPFTPWRVEIACAVSAALPSGAAVMVSAPGSSTVLSITSDPTHPGGLAGVYQYLAGTLVVGVQLAMPSMLLPGPLTIALEGRERWIFIYVNGQLAAVAPMPTSQAPFRDFNYTAAGGSAVVDVQSFTYERGLPFLMRGQPGDYALPGSPTPGGLRAEFFDDADLSVSVPDRISLTLNPTRTPYASRVDPTVHFAAGNWFPAGPANVWAARWTGSIFLDLANYDYRLALASSGPSRLWLGKTRMGEQLVDLWPVVATNSPLGGLGYTPYLRSIFGQVSGWYPIKIEFATYPGAPPPPNDLAVSLERSDFPTVFSAISPTQLSQFGCYINQVRRDSHHDTFQAIARAFGFQFTCQPQSLESGQFPGQLVPQARIGQDRNVTITADDSTQIGVQSSGEDMAVRIVADAQGIADPSSTAQLSATVVNYANATGHMFAATQADSASDITDPGLLGQRLGSLLALRSGTWDQIAARPDGHPRVVEAWPPAVVPLPSGFAWQPGDGVLRRFTQIGVVDQVPSQLASVLWDATPDGIGAPQTSWRVYPRGSWWTLRQFRQQTVSAKRNYQGQVIERTGSLGGLTGNTGDARSPGTNASSAYSLLALPPNLASIQFVGLVIVSKYDKSIQWTVEVNGLSTSLTVFAASPAPIPLTMFAARLSGSQPMMVVRLVPPTTHDTAEYMLVAQLAV